MPGQATYLKNYQPPVFAVDNLDLQVDLYSDHALVTSQICLRRQHEGPLILQGDSLELLSLAVDDKPLAEGSWRIIDGNLHIEHSADKLALTIVTRIYPQKNTALSGLYRSNSLFCTQCEAEGFRRITFYPDRPDVLTVFTTRITADKAKYPVLLSNGNLMGSGDLAEGRHWVLWQDPFKKPAYLFALVAGTLAVVKDEFVTASGRKVDLRIYVEPGNEDSCAHAMASLKRAMRWDEEVYGLEYDLDIFMIVAVNDFNMGAMENKGLNIFNAKFILAKPETATDTDFADIEGVVAHEYFHNWTGNRVTCRDWFQLSLKEGLTVFRDQEFSRDMHSRDVNRIVDVNMLRNSQFPEDAGKMAHPVRPESYQEINNFYTATIYNKGAEVIRMQHTLLGAAGFRRGMDLYFERHDGQAVTIDDFVKAMEDANQVDFSQLKHWYSQAGTPEVQVESHFDKGLLTLILQQSCPPTPECKDKKPFHIPIKIALFDAQGQALPLEKDILELKDAEQRFTFPNLAARPVVSLLRDFSAPVILKQAQSETDLLILLGCETNGFAKWDASRRLIRQCLLGWMSRPVHEWQISEAFLKAFQTILRKADLDMSLRSEILAPLAFEELCQGLSEIDIGLLENLRDHFRHQLGQYLYKDCESLYKTLWEQEDHGMYSEAYGRRKLRNRCLFYMMKAREEEALLYCETQFDSAKTMTDQLAALSLLANAVKSVPGQAAIDKFYQQWATNPLVLDKWFSVQASSEHPGTLNRVKALLNHPAFTFTNPNKVRALLGAFTQGNPRHFHALDGSGYAFLTEMLKIMDPVNPQISARLATPFTRWQRLDKVRQKRMQGELEILRKENLSVDLAEMVEKSLETL